MPIVTIWKGGGVGEIGFFILASTEKGKIKAAREISIELTERASHNPADPKVFPITPEFSLKW